MRIGYTLHTMYNIPVILYLRGVCLLKKTIAIFAILLMINLWGITAFADDAGLDGGVGETVWPLKGNPVVMEKEVIDIHVVDVRSYVTCTFYFYNPGEETQMLVGFPSEKNESGRDENGSYFFDKQLHNFTTKINGKETPIKLKKGKQKEDENGDITGYPLWYTWPMHFKKGQRIQVTNTYWMYDTYYTYANNQDIQYILQSGRNWQGPIGSVYVRMSFDDLQPYEVDGSLGLTPTGMSADGGLVWAYTNIEPDEDIYVEADSFDNQFADEAEDDYYSGDYKNAIKTCEDIIQDSPGEYCEAENYTMGRCYEQLKQYDKAIECFQTMGNKIGLYHEAQIYRKTGNTKAYLAALEKLILNTDTDNMLLTLWAREQYKADSVDNISYGHCMVY